MTGPAYKARMSVRAEGRLIQARSIRQMCQKLVNNNIYPTEPVELLNFDTGEVVTKVRYVPEKDEWQRWGRISTCVARRVPTQKVEVPDTTITVTLPSQTVGTVTVPEHTYHVTLPGYTFVATEGPREWVERVEYMGWLRVVHTKGMRPQTAPTPDEDKRELTVGGGR